MTGKKSMLKDSIFKVVAFFDAQDIALTLAEIQNYLDSKASLREIETCLDEDLAGKIESNGSLYFLRGRTNIAEARQERYRTSLLRFRKAKKYLWALRFFPYLRAVALSGSQALLNVTPESDVDLLIITKKNRIWLTRALISGYFQILGQRRHGRHVAGRFCLNHYLAEDKEITDDRNLYTAVEYANLLPVLGAENIARFWDNNKWIKEYLPAAVLETTQPFFDFRFSGMSLILETVLEYTIGPALNHVLGIYQKRRIRRQENILVSDDELSFHPGSHGQKVLEKYKKAVSTS